MLVMEELTVAITFKNRQQLWGNKIGTTGFKNAPYICIRYFNSDLVQSLLVQKLNI